MSRTFLNGITDPRSAASNLVYTSDASGNGSWQANPGLNAITALTGDGTATGPGSVGLTFATVNANVGSFGSASSVMTQTVNAKGLTTAAASVAIQITESQVTNLTTDLAGKQATGNYITALTGDGTATGPGSATFTLASIVGPGTLGGPVTVPVITVDAKGRVTGATAATIQPMQGWVDVTLFGGAPVLTSNTATANVTNMNTIMASVPSGTTIYFPAGIYAFNAALTMPAKNFIWQGQNSGVSGSNSIISLTANLAGTFITLPASQSYWQFSDLTFVSQGVNQTAGYVIEVSSNPTTNFFRCTFGGIGGNLFGCLSGTGANSWNTSVIRDCNFANYMGVAVNIDSLGCALVMAGCLMQGRYGSTTVGASMAVAGVQTGNCGALQIDSCDIIGNQTNLSLAPASGKVTSSVQVNNTYFDNAGITSLGISGAGGTVRCKFTGCTFTTAGAAAGTGLSTPPTALSAVTIGGSFVFATGTNAQGLDFVNCNIFNTFGTTGTTNGFLITNGADFTIDACRVAGWTNGINITPIAVAAVTRPIISSCAIGPTGGTWGANSIGVLFNAGVAAYGPVNLVNNQLGGNIQAVSDGISLVPGNGQKVYAGNSGLWTNSRNTQPAATGITTTETQIVSSPLPAGGAVINAMLRVTSYFTVSAAGTTTVTLRLGTSGTITDALLGTLTIAVAGTATVIKVEALVAVTAVGATGTVKTVASNTLWGTVPSLTNNVAINTASTTVNTTVNNFLGIYAKTTAGTLTNSITSIEPVSQT